MRADSCFIKKRPTSKSEDVERGWCYLILRGDLLILVKLGWNGIVQPVLSDFIASTGFPMAFFADDKAILYKPKGDLAERKVGPSRDRTSPTGHVDLASKQWQLVTGATLIVPGFLTAKDPSDQSPMDMVNPLINQLRGYYSVIIAPRFTDLGSVNWNKWAEEWVDCAEE